MINSPIIPEFMTYYDGLTAEEIEELNLRIAAFSKTTRDRFRAFTDLLLDYIGTDEWKNKSHAFLSMCAKAAFLRGQYGFNQILAKECNNIACKAYAAASYCRQSLNPRWINNLRNYVMQAWQEKDYVNFAELSGQLASILIDLGFATHAKEVAEESIEKVTEATVKNEKIRNKVQAALLGPRIILAYISLVQKSREEALIRLNSAEKSALHLDNQLAMVDINYYRARALRITNEYDEAIEILRTTLSKAEAMGYLQGVMRSLNLWGVINLGRGLLHEARDQFEELLVIQQQLNNQIGLANTLINVGEIDRLLGQLEQMETYNKKALEISQEAEYVKGIAIAKINLGDIEVRRGNPDYAISLYDEVVELVSSSGMKEFLDHVLLLSGDAYFISGNPMEAIVRYNQARTVSEEIDDALKCVYADVSKFVTYQYMDEAPPANLVEHVKDLMGDLDRWEQACNPSLMREVRCHVFNDDSIQGDLCIFFNNELNFECRVDRTSMDKECFGNIMWSGSLCTYLIDFINKLKKL